MKNVCLTTNNDKSSLREIIYCLSVEFTGTAVSLVYDCRTTFNLPITSYASTLFLVVSNLTYYTIDQTSTHGHNNIWVYYIILYTEFSTVDILFENKKTCLIRRLIICNIQLPINLICNNNILLLNRKAIGYHKNISVQSSHFLYVPPNLTNKLK